MNDHPYDELLHATPTPPPELHPLLKYLSDAFALLANWILQPGENDPHRLHIASRAHLSTTAEPGQVRLHHPDDEEGRPGYADTYERTNDGAAELLRDVSLQAVPRTEARSQWNTWDTEARRPEEIRIALRDAPGYYVQCPLDSDGKPYHAIATLERTPEDEDPNGARTVTVPVNRETERLLQMLTTCVAPLQP